MKRLFIATLTIVFALYAYKSQAQKLSIGVQGGLTTAMGVSVEGKQPANFKPLPELDLSKGLLLQYDLSEHFYLRGTLKKVNVLVTNRMKAGPGDTVGYEGDYGANFNSRQLGLALGYRKSLNQRWQITGSLGAAYQKLQYYDHDWYNSTNDFRIPFEVTTRVEFLDLNSVLLTGSAGLEYKTSRNHAIMLEAGYHKGFKTVGNSNFIITDRRNPDPATNTYKASLSTKGDYAEIRLGYRIPLQEVANLYKAVKRPKVKSAPEPDSVKNQRFIGKYWGLEIGRQTFYADQVVELPNFTDKSRVVSPWTPSFTFFKGYQFKNRFSLEAGFRAGASSVSANAGAVPIPGFNGGWSGGTWSILTLTMPVSVKYALPIVRNKLFLSPEAGLWQSYAFGMGDTDAFPTMNGIPAHLKGYGHDYFVGYHAGLSLNGRVGKRAEIGIGYRYANRFTNKPLMSKAPGHGPNSPLPHVLISKSNLRHDMVTISFRKFFRQ